MMTDLEICKRIAEIEFGEHSDKWFYSQESNESPHSIVSAWQGDGIFGCYREYNPLTDKALCFDLMVKYEVSLTYGEYAVTAEILIKKEDGEHSFDAQAYCPKLAICLAIIDSQGE